jgi:lantibiotic biosynthesis protein
MTATKRTYDARRMPFVVGRTPLLPLSAITGIYSAAQPLDAMRQLLETNPLVRQALYVASPSLAEAIDAWLRDEKLRNPDTPLRALAYVARMAGRPTPFALCAGIGTVDVGETTTLAIEEGARGTHTRPDMGLIADVIATIEASESKRRIHYVTNRAAIERGGRLYVTHVKLATRQASGTEQRPVSLKNTGSVQLVRELAQQPQSYDTLAEAIAGRYDAPLQEAERLLDRLIEAGVVISELCVSPVGDPVNALQERLERIDPQAARALDAATQDAAELDDTPIERRTLRSYQTVVERFSALSEKPSDHAVQIDMESPFSGTLGAAILEDAERLADYWIRLAPVLTLKTFRERFEVRYEGNERMVPLLELVDPNLGLGVPDSTERRDKTNPKRDALLMRIACEAARSACVEAELTADDLDIVIPPLSPSDESITASGEVGFHIAAGSTEAIQRGEYLLVPGGFVASSRATRHLGRFGHLFDEPARGRMRAVAREDRRGGDALAAELVYAPPTARMYNVAMRPPIFDTELRIGIGGPPAPGEIAPDDLWVGLEGDRFFLWSQSRQRRISPRESHVFNTDRNAPNLCRFLASLEFDGRRAVSGFDWGAAEHMTYLPRLRIGRIVLSERRWHFAVKDLGNSVEDAARALERLRALWAMPRYVYLASTDNRLLIDLDSPIAANLIFDQRDDQPALTFVEALPAPDEVWTAGTHGSYAVEFVASVLPVERPQLAPANDVSTPRTIVARRRFGLGSNWTYVKLYMGEQAVDDFIVRTVAPLITGLLQGESIDRWFFVRYADPQPHVRLRVRAITPHSASVRERIVAASEEWLREQRIARCVFDTYDPEYERYGGAEQLDAAERLFTRDSQICATLLAHTTDAPESRIAAAVESFVPWLCRDDLGEFTLDAFANIAKRKLEAADREQLKRIAALDFENDETALEEALAGAGRADRLRSLFHMHCNRIGVCYDDESRAVALLRAVMLSRGARKSSRTTATV